MSTTNPTPDRPATPNWTALAERSISTLLTPVQFAGFWTAVLLPFVLFPMLVSGMASEQLVPFVALLATNLVALVLGRDYNRD
jgi:hypothetical protein